MSQTILEYAYLDPTLKSKMVVFTPNKHCVLSKFSHQLPADYWSKCTTMNSSSLFGPTVASLWGGRLKRKGVRRPRTGLTAGSNLPAEVSTALGEAEAHFINGNYDQAIDMLSEVSIKAPRHPEPYSMMALIYETSGDLEKALPLYVLTATFSSKAGSLHMWTKVAEIASELGELDQAISALKRCINQSSSPEFYQQKIRIFLRQKTINNAKTGLNQLISRFKDQEYFYVEFGNLAMSVGYSDVAINSYTKYIFYLLGTTQVRTDLLPALASVPTQLPKHTNYILQHINYLYEALFKAVDALVDRPDGQAIAMELVEVCGEWTLAVKASLPPDAAEMSGNELPELPLHVIILYAVCKFRQEQDGPIAEAMNMLKQVFALLDQGELLPHLLTSPTSSDGSSSCSGGDAGEGAGDGLDVDSAEAYLVEALCDDLDLLRQLMRTALELVRIGVNTRAQRVLAFLDTCLRALGRKQIVLAYTDPVLALPAVERAVLKSKVERDIPHLWCQMASACDTLGRTSQALAAYQAALAINAHHAVSLTEYAQLVRTMEPSAPTELATARTLLQQHFETRVREFESLRQQQQGGPAQASPNTTAAISDTPTVRLRANKRTAAQMEESERNMQSLDQLRRSVQAAVPVAAQEGDQEGEGGHMDVVDDTHLALGQEDEDSDHSDEDEAGDREDFEIDIDSDLGMQDEDSEGEGSGSSGEEDEAEDEEAEEEGRPRRRRARKANSLQQMARLHWRASNTTTQFTEDDVKAEILALVEWSKLLFDDNSMLAFCAVAVPLVQSWTQSSTDSRGGGSGSNTNLATAAAAGDSSATPKSSAPKLGRKLRNKEAQTVSMYLLALSGDNDAATTAATSTGSEMTRALLSLLNAHQTSCFQLSTAFAQVVRLEHILSKDTLLGIATQVRAALASLNLANFGAEMLQRCSLKSIEKFNYSSGRVRTSTVKYVEYTADAPTTASASSVGGTAGRAGSPSSGPVIIAWNKIRRPVEDPLITAATRLSERAGLLARKLIDAPQDVHCANAFYSELVQHCLLTNPGDPGNAALEFQVPLGRLAVTAPRSSIAQYLAGHDFAMQRKHSYAIERYTAAFCLDPTQPIIALTLGAYLLMLAQHKLTKQRHEVMLKGIAFVHRYLTLRRSAVSAEVVQGVEDCVAASGYEFTDETHSCGSSCSSNGELTAAQQHELAMYQETCYNLGRAFHDMHLPHLACDQYHRALALAAQHDCLTRPVAGNITGVTRLAAHNLVQIYRQSGSKDMALEVMQRFLSN